jgi:regulation of enolase protein 1 (concanavalin A-like superfamily)
MSSFTLPTMPAELEWQNMPLDWKAEPTRLSITAGESTDWFIDPNGGFTKGNAPNALFTPPDENFLLSARVMVDFGATYDAGVLRIHESDTVWAKACFEYSPQGKPMVVSVVTRGSSDDCNSTVIDGDSVYLRISRNGQTFAIHYSTDGGFWHMVRYFSLGKVENLKIGFSSQSPTGQQCTVVFTEMMYTPGVLNDIRNGE